MQTEHRPNNAFRAVRLAMRLSQDEMAEQMRHAGAASTTKRTIQRYESGEILSPRPASARALEVVTRLPIASLGFPEGADTVVVDDGRGGHDLEVRRAGLPAQGPGRANGGYSGIWLSRYEYYSSSRSQEFSNAHYVVILQHGDRLTVRSVHGSEKSLLTMDLVIDGSVVTGTWAEETETGSYYRGARYHGAIQLLGEPTGRRLAGKWVGFGKELDVNTGPWELTFQDASTSKNTLAKFLQAPEVE
jgi:transcriptional regulator with XRE-family HTH domain